MHLSLKLCKDLCKETYLKLVVAIFLKLLRCVKLVGFFFFFVELVGIYWSCFDVRYQAVLDLNRALESIAS